MANYQVLFMLNSFSLQSRLESEVTVKSNIIWLIFSCFKYLKI